MLASGDWLVPRVGSDPYLRKPPLLNWAIALSCKLTGGVSEWAVRLPSVLATFALALTIVGVAGRRWLGLEGGLIAAIFFLVNFTMIETGRLAELEALYVAFTGIALVSLDDLVAPGSRLLEALALAGSVSCFGYADERPNTSHFLLWGCSASSSFWQEYAFPASPGAFAFTDPDQSERCSAGQFRARAPSASKSDWCLALLVGSTCFPRICRIRSAFSACDLAAQWSANTEELFAVDLAVASPVEEENGCNDHRARPVLPPEIWRCSGEHDGGWWRLPF